jgi:hypothetical protein
MIYRVFSSSFTDERTLSAQGSWHVPGINNIPIQDSTLGRNIESLPYLKDILDIGYYHCLNDNDIILYTNSDIGLVNSNVQFPNNNFFSVRKNVEKIGTYTSSDLELIGYEHSVNCDVFGITKKWYKENRNQIPDFLIGSPTWDLCLLILLNGERIDNICYHVRHDSKWKGEIQNSKHLRNRQLFTDFCQQRGIQIISDNGRILSNNFYKYMANNLGYDYLLRPKYIIYSTPSHSELLDLNMKSLKDIYKDKVIIHNIKDDNQYCNTANYHETGWKQTQINKVESLIKVLNKFNNEEIFIFCDADIIHLKDYLQEITILLDKYEMLAQKSFSTKESSGYCSGFFASKKTDKVMRFLNYILQSLKFTSNSESHADQYYFNKYSNILNIGYLDNTYFNPGIISNGKVVEKDTFSSIKNLIPIDVNMVHANWIKGSENKLKFLQCF